MGNFFAWAGNTAIPWLFTDAQTEAGGPSGSPTPFHPMWWIVAVALLLLIPFYYSVEGRKRIPWIKDHTIWKQTFDRLLPAAGWLGFVGAIIIGARVYLFYTIFSWRVWLIGWLLWGVILLIRWTVYFVRDFPRMNDAYTAKLERDKFDPAVNKNKKRTAAARR